MSDVFILPQPQPFAIPSGYGAGGATGAKGDPGGNVMAIGLFTALSLLSIPLGTDIVQTSGHSAPGVGQAQYIADAAVDAAWVAAHPNAGGVSANGRGFRLSLSQLLEPLHFGAASGDIRDDHAEIEYGLTFTTAYARAVGSYNLAAAGLFIAPHLCYYVGSHTFDLFQTTGFFGQNSGLPQDFRSGMRWDDGCVGVRFQASNTSGATGTDGVTHNAADGATVDGIWLRAGYTNFMVTEGEWHAIQMRTHGTVRRCNFTNWAGHAVYINCSALDPTTRGNANGWRIDTITATYCRTPYWVQGSDGNAGKATGVIATNCRQAGPVDTSFLANKHDFWSEACGAVPGCYYAVWCSYSGNVYQVKWGQEAGASTNAPSGTTADNTWWKYLYAGGVASIVNRPLWTSGLTWRSGGAYVINCYNLPCQVDSSYIEGGAPMAQTAMKALIIAPQDGAGMFGIDGFGIGTVIMPVSPGTFQISTNLNVMGSITADGFDPHRIGPTSGTLDTHFEQATPAAFNFRYFRTYLNGVLQNTEGTIASHSSGAMYFDGRLATHLQIAGLDIAILDSTGIDLQSGKVLKAAGNQVVGARGAAVADTAALTSANAVNAAAAPTQAEFNAFVAEFNKLRTDVDAVRTTGNTTLARVRASTGHGLIA